MSAVKGLSPSEKQFDGSPLRVAIVHARWNKEVIDALVTGCISTLKSMGVKDSNIVIQSVPGSFELPVACSKVIAGSRVQAGSSAGDLLGLSFNASNPNLNKPPPSAGAPGPTVVSMPGTPFDAVIAIGVLIKGSTMHFEYISDAVSHALMRVQLDTNVPVIFGVLTALTDDQALDRAGIGRGFNKGHNHGEDWARAAVEMGVQAKNWQEGKFV
ncbi:6,7-dimetjyl-8-ribityllumazine synthase [Coniophora puteana RWD-64-598 SS2]|uniref:6,7-dimethyl-8-ribityllumazine synthase n=1 Tax=Coniophora puteana (strain RWD-64-598) TaxID=741705 RepID=A0A5M3N0K1_CONPW|nr:6,7-dimetjyl-8-ribityllumazine synthase [Coniophora puteana RWD-64-598 SS2]EIW84806.1 6,7-dimetjyl-8-ribityllumazine synthase [Coniophora puteana RWD-64-598 SS2]